MGERALASLRKVNIAVIAALLLVFFAAPRFARAQEESEMPSVVGDDDTSDPPSKDEKKRPDSTDPEDEDPAKTDPEGERHDAARHTRDREADPETPNKDATKPDDDDAVKPDDASAGLFDPGRVALGLCFQFALALDAASQGVLSTNAPPFGGMLRVGYEIYGVVVPQIIVEAHGDQALVDALGGARVQDPIGRLRPYLDLGAGAMVPVQQQLGVLFAFGGGLGLDWRVGKVSKTFLTGRIGYVQGVGGGLPVRMIVFGLGVDFIH